MLQRSKIDIFRLSSRNIKLLLSLSRLFNRWWMCNLAIKYSQRECFEFLLNKKNLILFRRVGFFINLVVYILFFYFVIDLIKFNIFFLLSLLELSIFLFAIFSQIFILLLFIFRFVWWVFWEIYWIKSLEPILCIILDVWRRLFCRRFSKIMRRFYRVCESILSSFLIKNIAVEVLFWEQEWEMLMKKSKQEISKFLKPMR